MRNKWAGHEPIAVTDGDIVAETLHDFYTVRCGNDTWSVSFPMHNLEVEQATHARMVKWTKITPANRKRSKHVAAALAKLITAIAAADVERRARLHG